MRPVDDEDIVFKYGRSSWRAAGIDNFSIAPNQPEDSFQQLLNILPPMTNVIQRRFGYATFVPRLDTGVATGSDTIPQNALYGANFDGEAGYVYTSKSPTWNYANPVVSVEFWFETNSVNGGYFISFNEDMQITAGDVEIFGIYMNANGNVGVGLFNGATVELSALTTATYNDGTGHMVDVVLNGSSLVVYIDNVVVITSTLSTGTGSHTGYWRLAEGPSVGGGWPTGISNFMQTFLSHVAVFNNIALTSANVNADWLAMTSATGTQAIYEAQVLSLKPTYYWFLTDTLAAPPASQSVIIQNQTAAWNAATGSATQNVVFPSPVSANHIILLCVGDSFGGVTGITDSQGNSYTEITAATFPNFNAYGIEAWYAETSAAGNLTVNITTSTTFTGNTQQAIMFELQNVVVPDPLDTANVAEGNGVNIVSGTITTTDEPDIVFSFVTANAVCTLVPGQGFVLVASNTTTNNRSTATKTMAAAYRQSNALATFNCDWTNANSAIWLANTIAFQLNLPVANTNGDTAFDSADTNTGTYFIDIIPNSISNPAWTGSGTASVSMTVTATQPGIEIGDTGTVLIQAAPSTLTVTGVTDSLGNTYVQQTPNGLAYDTTRIFSIWTSSMQTAVTVGGTFTITATLSANCTAIQGAFFNTPDLGLIQIASHNTGNSATPSSNGVTTTGATALFAFATGANALTGYPAAPWSGTPFLLDSTANGYAVDLAYTATGGTYVDTWTMSSGPWAAVVLAFLTTPGFFLGEFIIVS